MVATLVPKNYMIYHSCCAFTDFELSQNASLLFICLIVILGVVVKMELLVCFMFIVVMLVQFVGLLAIYQLLAKNTNKQIERQTEYLEGISFTFHEKKYSMKTCPCNISIFWL